MNQIFRAKFFLFLALFVPAAAFTQPDYRLGPVDTGEVVAELVADVAAIQPGQEFDVALRLEMDPHWHVYWINPGDVGFPPQVEWDLPEGFEVGEFIFPTPERIPFPPLLSYGYEGELFLVAKMTAPESLEVGEPVRIQASANWLVCEEACIPGNADLALELPVTSTGESLAASNYADDIASTLASLPTEASGGEIATESLGDTLVVTLQWDGLEGVKLEDPYFYIEQDSVADSAKPQTFDLNGNVLRIAVPKSEYFEEPEGGYSGLLYSENGFESAGGRSAVRFHVTGDLASMAAPQTAAVSQSFQVGFGQALLYAFLGGMILNLMPCVFPVLSIKVLGFVQQSGEDKGKILKHGVLFTLGVLISFWVLAGVLIALRAAGESIGWGFQLQQPAFVIVMLVVMFLFGLSLAGVFEVGTSAVSLQGKVKGNDYLGSFFSGVIATAVATPCTGPFMGPALGFALTLSAFQSLTVFTFLALGMAAPYLILSANPSLINKLPRPGAWMETFKQVMAFPMFATCIWLIWLLGGHVGNDGLIFVLGGLLVIALGAWIYGRWSTPSRKAFTRRLSGAIAVLVVLGGIWMMLPREAGADSGNDVQWQAYSPDLVEELSRSGRPVFVDFTADWCLTCKANEIRLFSSDKVKDRIQEMDVALVQGDWTKKDPVITKALEAYGRSSVPLYLLYDGNGGSEPKVLPQVLSPDAFIEYLDEIETANGSVAMN